MVRGHVMIRDPSGTAVSREMNRTIVLGCTLSIALSGCMPKGAETAAPSTGATAQTPVAVQRPRAAEISWDTDRDRVFAEFLREKSGGMVRKAAVGIERAAKLRIELDRSVAPEDTLPLTKSIMAGARRRLPRPADHPVGLRPQGEPILKARYRPGDGVQYQIAHDGAATRAGRSRAGRAARRPIRWRAPA